MSREEVEKLLEEVDKQRDQLKKELEEIDALRMEVAKKLGCEYDEKKEDVVEEKVRSDKVYYSDPYDMMEATKKALRKSVETGTLQDTLKKIADGLELSKAAVLTLSKVVEKAEEKMEGKVETLPGPLGSDIMTDMWLPMMLNIMKTEEFQHILANLLVSMIK